MVIASLLIAAAATPVLAQRGRWSREQIGDLIRTLERETNDFRKDFDRALDRSRLNNSGREDRVNASMKRFENEMDEVRREFARRDDWWDIRDNVRKAVNAARDVDRTMRNQRLGPQVERQWVAIRRGMNVLATRYDVPRL
jgi:hypothetical protein